MVSPRLPPCPPLQIWKNSNTVKSLLLKSFQIYSGIYEQEPLDLSWSVIRPNFHFLNVITHKYCLFDTLQSCCAHSWPLEDTLFWWCHDLSCCATAETKSCFCGYTQLLFTNSMCLVSWCHLILRLLFTTINFLLPFLPQFVVALNNLWIFFIAIVAYYTSYRGEWQESKGHDLNLKSCTSMSHLDVPENF